MNENSLKQEIINKINNKEIRMLPKTYFLLGHAFLGISIILGVTVTSIFFSLLFFRIETDKPMDVNHLKWLTKIPWEYGLLAIIFLIISLLLLKKSEMAYKLRISTILLALLLISIISGLVIKEFSPTRNIIRGVQQYNRRQDSPPRNFPKHSPRKFRTR